LLRTWAWLSGALAFLVPWVAFRVQPKPAVALVPMSATSSSRKVIVVHRILRRIVIDAPEEAAGPRYVYAAPTSGTSTVAPSGSSSAPAATSTGGSVP
jgi:hypothetical protein